MNRRIGIFAALALVAGFAQAQEAWRTAGEGHSIAVTSSASLAERLTSFSTDQSCAQVSISNTGGVDAYVELASTAAGAVPDIPAAGNPGSSFLVQAGTTMDVKAPNQPYISAKTASGSTTLVAVCSDGVRRGTTGILLGTGTSATQVQGTQASGAAVTGNPVLLGASNGTNVVTLRSEDDNSDDAAASATDHHLAVIAKMQAFDGTTWDRLRGDSSNGLKVYTGAPAAASILAGSQSYTATQAATTIITIPAGNTWVGEVAISASVGIAAASSTAGHALGVVTYTGAGSTPPAGQAFDCEARAGANAATGTVGGSGANSCRLTVVVNCASGTCTLAGATTQAGTASRVSFSAAGRIY